MRSVRRMNVKLQLKNQVETVLKNVARKQNLSNFELIFNIDEAIRGDGFLGEFFLAGIKNKNTNETIQLAIKKAVKDESKRAEFRISWVYSNEVFFYSTIFPTLNKLQIEKSLRQPFVEIAKFYYGTLEEFQETVVLENIKQQGYDVRPKKELFDDEHTRLIFHTYGKFHALSFALKDQNFEVYKKLVNGIKMEIMEAVTWSDSYEKLNKSITNDCYEALDPEIDADVIKKFEKYRTHGAEEFRKALNLIQNSDSKIIVHGDCWSNNMMFKYSNSGKLENVKLIDFQIITEANPVNDLSYFFYSGASKEQFDKLDDYLKVYHDSLSKNLRDLGSDPEKLYTFQQLKKDWVKHAIYGLILSIVLVKVKLIDNTNIQDIVKDNTDEDVLTNISNSIVDKDLLHERLRNILVHAAEIDVL